MTQQYTPNLGETPKEDARRDAVHVAVAPVIAGEKLMPGEHVGLFPDGTMGLTGERIGVVDPFYNKNDSTAYIIPGQRFWLFLYPGTVTSLRHVWTHPAFQTKILVREDKHGTGS